MTDEATLGNAEPVVVDPVPAETPKMPQTIVADAADFEGIEFDVLEIDCTTGVVTPRMFTDDELARRAASAKEDDERIAALSAASAAAAQKQSERVADRATLKDGRTDKNAAEYDAAIARLLGAS